jgi:tetratricopeptide (TPR) repeat protein
MRYAILLMALALATPLAVTETQALGSALLSRVETGFSPDKADALLAEAALAPQPERDLYVGIIYHNLALAKPAAGYEEKAIERLRAAEVKGSQNENLARAYEGSCITLKAAGRDKQGDAAGATLLLEKGFALLDAAVKAEPNRIDLRFLRAENSVDVSASSPFSRVPEAKADCAVIQAHEAELSPAEAAALHLALGKIAQLERRVDLALREWERAVKLAPASPGAAEARKLISRYED